MPVPGLGLLSYRATGPVHKGARVRVPLGARSVVGVVVDEDTSPPQATLKDITEVIDDTPFVPPAVVDLARWVGQYYAAGPGGALALAMPVAARQGEKESFRTARVAALLPAATSAVLKGAKQRAALEQLQKRDGRASLADLKAAGVSGATVASLQRAGILHTTDEVSMRDPFAGGGDEGRWTLGPAAPRNGR